MESPLEKSNFILGLKSFHKQIFIYNVWYTMKDNTTHKETS